MPYATQPTAAQDALSTWAPNRRCPAHLADVANREVISNGDDVHAMREVAQATNCLLKSCCSSTPAGRKQHGHSTEKDVSVDAMHWICCVAAVSCSKQQIYAKCLAPAIDLAVIASHHQQR